MVDRSHRVVQPGRQLPVAPVPITPGASPTSSTPTVKIDPTTGKPYTSAKIQQLLAAVINGQLSPGAFQQMTGLTAQGQGPNPLGFIGNAASGIAGDFLKTFSPILKIAAGGLGIIVSGLALVYVAGRNTSGGQAGRGAVDAVTKVAPPPARAAVKIAKRVPRPKPKTTVRAAPRPAVEKISLRGASPQKRAAISKMVAGGRVRTKGGE